MADVAETATFTEPTLAISQGRRHLLVRDYSMAVSALAQACQLLAEKHGDTADELGEPYLLYGRALLGLAREEAGVLGDRVPGSEEAEEDDDEEEEEEEKLSAVDEKEEEEEEEQPSSTGDKEESEEKKDKSEEEKKDKSKEEEKKDKTKEEEKKDKTKEEEKKDKTKEEEKKDKTKEGENKDKTKEEEKKDKTEEVEKKDSAAKEEKKEETKEPKKSEEKKQESKEEKQPEKGEESNKTDDSKIAEQNAQQSKTKEEEEKDTVTPGSSKEASQANGPSSSTEQNGEVKETNDDSEDIEKEEEEEEVNNLQVAWEVLELAKLVLQKRGQPGWKLLADAYRLLGEVAMEGGNHQGALNDLHGCLDLLQKVEPRDARAIAEIHYQLALAHSLGNDFDQSIEEFNKATSLLESRIKELEEMKDPPKTEDTFYTVEGEIQELKELLPEIQEKITDMKDFKQEACRLVIEGIKSKVAGGCSNGAGPSGAETSSTTTTSAAAAAAKVQKPASDISHLVRKKRKADEPEPEPASPCKKPTPEKAV